MPAKLFHYRNHTKVSWKGFYDGCLHNQCDKNDVVSILFSNHIEDILLKRCLLVYFCTFTTYEKLFYKRKIARICEEK